MSGKYNVNIKVSLNYSNKKLTELPKELYQHKNDLFSLDISANPLKDLDKTINELKEFKSLRNLKINIETGNEAKKLIESLPFLKVLNDIKIQQDENKINNQNNNTTEKIENNDAKDKNNEKIIDNNFEIILEKIKEYDDLPKEKYDLIINDYNKLINKNKIKNTLEICSYFNKILINLIKDAQEKENLKIGSLKPLLEAQTQNEFIRINYESKLNLNNNKIKTNLHEISIDSPREKIKQIKTETASISFVNSNKNITNSNIMNKKIVRNNTMKNKNKNEIRKEYSKNIKNLSLSKNKKLDKDSKSEFENENKIFKKDITQQSRNNINTLSKNIRDDISKKSSKKKFKFTHKSHNKKILNKTSYKYLQENTDENSNTNMNTETLTQTMNIENNMTNNNNNNNATNKKRIKNSKYMNKTISSISDTNITTINNNNKNNNNYFYKYNMLKNCLDNSTINSFLNQMEQQNFGIYNNFDNLKELINIDINSIRVLNIKNILDIISQVYRQRNIRLQKKLQGTYYIKGTLETDLISYLKSKYGLKKMIIEWFLTILSSIKAYSKINGEICLFGLILRNELDEGSIDILQKIKETVGNILNHLYKYNNIIVEKIKNNKEYMKENEWIFICQVLYCNDIKLREKFENKIYEFIRKMIKSDKILEKIGKKILFCDFLNLLIMFNLRQRKKYLKNLVNIFQNYDKEKFGVINYEEFKLMIKELGYFDKSKINDIINHLVEKCDKETTGQITFNEVVECFDNYYLDNLDKNKTQDKIKLLDKISNLN